MVKNIDLKEIKETPLTIRRKVVKLKGTGKKSPKIFKIRIKMVEKKVRPLLKKGLTKSLPVIKITGRIEAAKDDTKKGDGKKMGRSKKIP